MFFFKLKKKPEVSHPLKITRQTFQSIVLVSIFKNEGHILQEWIEHYLREGVDMFYLIDNGSTDNYLEKIQKYIDLGKVVLNIDNTKHKQAELYNKYYLNLCKRAAWVIVVDLDEFMYSRNGYNTIKEYLNSLDNHISVITIPWKMFGSNGFIQQPEGVIHNFTKRQEYVSNYSINVKTIIRGKQLKQIDIHCSQLLNYPTIISNTITEETLRNDNIHLNHYAIQSLDFFTNIKMTRGACDGIMHENVRTLEYFKKYDHNDIIDEELKNKIYKK